MNRWREFLREWHASQPVVAGLYEPFARTQARDAPAEPFEHTLCDIERADMDADR